MLVVILIDSPEGLVSTDLQRSRRRVQCEWDIFFPLQPSGQVTQIADRNYRIL
jgi:hypothetical protein